MGVIKPANRPMPYESVIYLFLSLYRFFSYALAVVLIQTRVVRTEADPNLQTYVILGVVGVYTLLKAFSPLQWQQKSSTTYIIWASDVLLSVILLMFTHGLESGFLLFALTPIIASSLLFGRTITLATSGIISLSLLIVHLVVTQWSDYYVWIMDDNYLPLLTVYIICCFLIAILAYQTNLNILQRIETGAIFEERRRIRRELHDGVAQKLSYLNMRTSSVKDSVSAHEVDKALVGLEDIKKTVKDTYEEVRQAIDSLSDGNVFPLVPTLSEYVQEFGERSNIEAKFESPQNLPRLSPMAELQLLRIAYEALTNVRKYAEASKVTVKLEPVPSGVKMTVTDNGIGFSFSDYEKNPAGSHGLNIMRERAEGVGGRFAVSANPGQGVEISVVVPVTKVRF